MDGGGDNKISKIMPALNVIPNVSAVLKTKNDLLEKKKKKKSKSKKRNKNKDEEIIDFGDEKKFIDLVDMTLDQLNSTDQKTEKLSESLIEKMHNLHKKKNKIDTEM